jgi:hypothetical protein
MQGKMVASELTPTNSQFLYIFLIDEWPSVPSDIGLSTVPYMYGYGHILYGQYIALSRTVS